MARLERFVPLVHVTCPRTGVGMYVPLLRQHMGGNLMVKVRDGRFWIGGRPIWAECFGWHVEYACPQCVDGMGNPFVHAEALDKAPADESWRRHKNWSNELINEAIMRNLSASS